MPEQHDPLDDLTRFGAGIGAGSGVPMPFSAGEARQRGDRLRRRRRALVAGGSALAVAAVAVPVFALAGGSPRADDDRGLTAVDPTPSVSASVPATALPTAVLLTDDDTVYNEGSDWVRTGAYEGDGQEPFHPCARATLASLGAASVVVGDYELRSPGQDQPARGALLQEAVARFDSEDAARAARATVVGWIRDCGEAVRTFGATAYRTLQTRRLDAGAAVDAQIIDARIIDAQYSPVDTSIDPSGDSAYIAETGVAVQGSDLVVLGSQVVGQDYNFLPEEGGTPVNRMLPVALERLRDSR
ncbi:hypothetical protein [Nocardioides sp.]|uniref:hypothetical protein n=1 Tax=Nocardioides sp. TaxID=35761 RepID=UPI0035194A5C